MSALRNVHKLGLIALAAAMLALLAACGSPEPTPTSPAPAPTAVAPGEPQPTPTAAVDPEFDAEAYFRGKTIRMVVGYAPGGGTDVGARYVAAEWRRFIPGNPNIAVSNITPAPAEMNFTWRANPDGLTIAHDATSALSQQYLPQAEHRLAEMPFVGSWGAYDSSWMIYHDLPYDSILDARGGTTPISKAIAAATPADLTGFDIPSVLLAHWFDFPLELKLIAGAGSVAEELIMIERGEVNSRFTNLLWARLPQLRGGWASEGRLKLFVDVSPPEVPFPGNEEVPANQVNVPNIYEHLDAEQRELFLAAIGAQIMYSKGMLTTPGTPPEVMNALRRAWDDAVQDQAFHDGLARVTGAPILTLGGEETQEMVIENANAFDAKRDELTGLMEELAPAYMR